MTPARFRHAPPLSRLIRAIFLCGLLCVPKLFAETTPPDDGPSQRRHQVALAVRIAEPVLTSAARGTLKKDLPVFGKEREDFSSLEALARTLTGLAPWLELGPGDDAEGQQRARLLALARQAITVAVDPASSGALNFNRGKQPLVDAAFLAESLLRAPNQLWGKLSAPAQANVIAALKSTRVIEPYESNWLLFSATIEAALLKFTGMCDMAPIENAVSKHLAWYKGDGIYGDGADFHFDYYNSYVIQPMLCEVLEVCADKHLEIGASLPLVQRRAQRYAEILERLISPEGTFPVIGRSSCYRVAALQGLLWVALRRQLPGTLSPGAVRAGTDRVIHRMMEEHSAFDAAGWLRVGAVGAQPSLAEGYISTGSVYLCTQGFLPLGLPENDPYWTVAPQAWTQKRLWDGEDLPADHALQN